MKKTLVFLICCIVANGLLLAQKQANNWVFGRNVVLSWNNLQNIDAKRLDNGSVINLKRIPTTLPASVFSSANAFNSTATSFALSNKDGELILFSNSENFWNNNYINRGRIPSSNYIGLTASGGVLMPVGSSLTNFVGIIPQTYANGIIATDISVNSNGFISFSNSLDLKLRVEPYVARNRIGQAATVVQRPNNRGLWIIVPEMYSNVPALHAVTFSSVGSLPSSGYIPTVTSVGPAAPASFPSSLTNLFTGQMKISPNSKYFVWGTGIGYVLLGKFDIETGKISDIKYMNNSSVAVEFSRNGKFVYLAYGKDTWIYNTEELLGAANPNAISSVYSYTVPAPTNNTCFLQLAPDGRIYQTVAADNNSQTGARNMIVINKPENADTDPQVCVLENILQPGTSSSGGLCNFSGSWFSSDVEGPFEVCATAEETYSHTYASGLVTGTITYTRWNFGDGTIVDIPITNPALGAGLVTCTHTYQNPGTYGVTVSSYTTNPSLGTPPINTTMQHLVIVNSCAVRVNPHISISVK